MARSSKRSAGSANGAAAVETETSHPPVAVYVPTADQIKAELWSIATGEGSEASRVSALRALADITGIMKSSSMELPEGMRALMDALAEGLGPD